MTLIFNGNFSNLSPPVYGSDWIWIPSGIKWGKWNNLAVPTVVALTVHHCITQPAYRVHFGANVP